MVSVLSLNLNNKSLNDELSRYGFVRNRKASLAFQFRHLDIDFELEILLRWLMSGLPPYYIRNLLYDLQSNKTIKT